MSADNALVEATRYLGREVPADELALLTALHLLPKYSLRSGAAAYIHNDVVDALPFLDKIQEWGRDHNRLGRTLFDPGGPAFLELPDQTQIWLPPSGHDVDPAFYVAVRNLPKAKCGYRSTSAIKTSYFPPARIHTLSRELLDFANHQVERATAVRASRSGEFANSAHYMGSKRELTGFLTEAFLSEIGDDGSVVDLMCGSGVVAGACSRIWPTFASDSQEFCTLLARVQGGGFSRGRAEEVLSRVLPAARKHALGLCLQLEKYVAEEDTLFNGDLTEALRSRYEMFVDGFVTYPSAGPLAWNPLAEVTLRKENNRLTPYVLCTAYFANVFFGLRQSIEIDSLRFGIDYLQDPEERSWALGALVATASKTATIYAGHFAQPLVRRWHEVSLASFEKIIERRSLSVFQEFSVRMVNLAQESENAKNRISIVRGPWRTALDELGGRSGSGRRLVYLDPPYRREEYSRYYHVLETLVRYSYPSSAGIGRTPAKDGDDRFSSEFFTRTHHKMTLALANVIHEVVKRGWTCAWSYADNSDANISEVIAQVEGQVRIQGRSFAAPYVHHSQGRGRGPRKVTEYLIMAKSN